MLVVAASLRIAWFHVADRSPDEHLYAAFGQGIVQEGLRWFPRNVGLYVGEGDVEYPWVHRVGFLSLVALAQIATRRNDPVAGEVLSTVASMGAVALTGVVAWSAIGPLTAALAMLFMAVSPLELAISRRAWGDTVTELCTLLMLVCAWRALVARRRAPWRAAFCLVSVFTLLVKESAVIPFGLASLAMAWRAWCESGRLRAAIAPLALAALTALVTATIVIALCGGLANAIELVKLTPAAWAPDQYLREYQTGGVGYYVTGLRILQPVPWALGLLAAALATLDAPLLVPRDLPTRQRRELRLLGVYVLVFLAVSCTYSSKNMRFLSPIYAPIAVLAAAWVSSLADWLRARVARTPWRLAMAGLAALLLASAVADARRFDHYFNEIQIQDLATPWFTKADAGKL